MHKIFILLAFSSILNFQSLGQIDTTYLKKFQTNFAVPDNPGFVLLGSQPSTILRNSKIQPLSIITEFVNGLSFSMPKSLGVELAPYQLLKPSQSYKDYKDNQIWNNLAISIGTLRDSQGISNLAFGLKWTLIDKTDPNYDNEYTKSVLASLNKDLDFRKKVREEFIAIHNIDISELESEKFKDLYSKFEKEKINEKIDLDEISRNKIQIQNKKWNQLKFDLAAAILNSTPNSAIDSIQFNKFGLWATLSSPLFNSTHSQNVCGLHYNYSESSNIHLVSLSDRIYVGSNRLKAFIEGQLNYNSLKQDIGYLANLGGEYNLFQSLWVEFGFGVYKNIQTGDKGKLSSTLNLKYAMF